MAWTAPKVDWTPPDGVADTHLNAVGDNLVYLKEQHVDLTTGIHGAVSTATASKLLIRDAAGRAKVVAPSAEDDIALKSNVTTEAAARVAADAILQAAIDLINEGGVYLPIAGGTMTGGAVGHVGTDYTTARFRNVLFGTVAPTTEGNNGDVYMRYEA
jgi:hypothetical protein